MRLSKERDLWSKRRRVRGTPTLASKFQGALFSFFLVPTRVKVGTQRESPTENNGSYYFVYRTVIEVYKGRFGPLLNRSQIYVGSVCSGSRIISVLHVFVCARRVWTLRVPRGRRGVVLKS